MMEGVYELALLYIKHFILIELKRT